MDEAARIKTMKTIKIESVIFVIVTLACCICESIIKSKQAENFAIPLWTHVIRLGVEPFAYCILGMLLTGILAILSKRLRKLKYLSLAGCLCVLAYILLLALYYTGNATAGKGIMYFAQHPWIHVIIGMIIGDFF